MAVQTIDIFISYSRSDAPFVNRLESALNQLGFTTWVDRSQLEGGQNWEREIQRAIDGSRAMIVVLSPAAVDSIYVQAEYGYALDKKKVILPFLYQPCEVPLRLRIYQWVAFTGSLEASVIDLRKALRLQGVSPSSPSLAPTPQPPAEPRTTPRPVPPNQASPQSTRIKLLVPISAISLVTLILSAVIANGILHSRDTGRSIGGGNTGTPSATNTVPVAHVKVGLVTDIGGLNDGGFNALANQGLQQAKAQFGSQVDVKVSTSDSDYAPNLRAFASQGYDLVIAVGFLMQTAVGTVAQEFPNTHFAIVDGVGADANGSELKQANVMDLLFKEQDAGALVGVIAGMLEKNGATPNKTGVISAVGGISIPPVNHYIAGYKWAATMEDPGISVLVDYSNDFADSSKCRDVANAQIAKKAEIVFQVAGGCGLGALAAAGQKGVYSIGVDTDQKSADNSVIASAIKKVDVAVYFAIKSQAQGTFNGGQQLFGLDNGGVSYTPGNITLDQNITAEIQHVSDQIKSGALTAPDTV